MPDSTKEGNKPDLFYHLKTEVDSGSGTLSEYMEEFLFGERFKGVLNSPARQKHQTKTVLHLVALYAIREGKTFVVANDVDRSSRRSYGDIEVSFVNLSGLIRALVS